MAMKPHMLETSLAQVLELAGIEPADASDWQVALADRMIQLSTSGHGVVNLRSAALALRRHLEAQR